MPDQVICMVFANSILVDLYPDVPPVLTHGTGAKVSSFSTGAKVSSFSTGAKVSSFSTSWDILTKYAKNKYLKLPTEVDGKIRNSRIL